MTPREPYPDDSELGGEPPRHVHYHQTKNGDASKIVWGVAAFAVMCLVTINGIMWGKLWDMADSMARLETRVEAILERLTQ